MSSAILVTDEDSSRPSPAWMPQRRESGNRLVHRTVTPERQQVPTLVSVPGLEASTMDLWPPPDHDQIEDGPPPPVDIAKPGPAWKIPWMSTKGMTLAICQSPPPDAPVDQVSNSRWDGVVLLETNLDEPIGLLYLEFALAEGTSNKVVEYLLEKARANKLQPWMHRIVLIGEDAGRYVIRKQLVEAGYPSRRIIDGALTKPIPTT